MRVLLLYILSIAAPLASCAGLSEDFTWTRISYVPRTSGRRPGRNAQSTYAKVKPNPDAIVFEGNINEENANEGIQSADSSIDYQYENNIPMGANVWRNKLFITVPRRRLGIPSTLNYVPLDSPQKHNVPLIPYPNWDINLYPGEGESSDNFFSVYRVAVDPCDRLWFVDTGILELPGNVTQIKPTTLVIIDLKTDKVIRRYVLPKDQLKSTTSTLASVTVDTTKETCDDAYAYLPDLSGYGLIVYNLRENKSWRVSHNYFFLESLAGDFFIAGHHFQWNDGVFSVELTEINRDGFRHMYFHSMAGTHIFRVSTSVLRNETLATRSYHENDFENVGDRGPLSQTSSADLHKNSGVIFLGLVNQNALGCWNIRRPLTSISIVHKDNEKMIYPCDVKVYDDRVYMLTNTMPGFLYGRLDYNKINFRVWSNEVSIAVERTNC